MMREEAEQRLLAYRTIEDTGEEYGYRIIKYLGEYDECHYFECVRNDIDPSEPQEHIWFFVSFLGAINMSPRKKMEPISREEAEQILQKYLDEENAEWGEDLQIIQYLKGGPHEHLFRCLDSGCKEPTLRDYVDISVADCGLVYVLPK